MGMKKIEGLRQSRASTGMSQQPSLLAEVLQTDLAWSESATRRGEMEDYYTSSFRSVLDDTELTFRLRYRLHGHGFPSFKLRQTLD